jgi:hypothetical protein
MVLLLSVPMENYICLSHGVHMVGATRRAAMMIVVGVGDLVQRTEDDQAQVRYSVAGRSRGRVTLYVVCTVHNETRSTGFLVEHENQGRRFLLVWTQNRWLRDSRFGPQNR